MEETASQAEQLLTQAEEEEEEILESSNGNVAIEPTTGQTFHTGGEHLSLRQKEEVAKAAYKTWLIIKPGNKEIKDHWWALYYKKLLPKYHLRDNYLGKLVNEWIQEDMKALTPQEPATSTSEESPVPKKRKANSVKDGSQPAYLNIMLVHPMKHTESNDPNAVKVASCCVNSDIEWTAASLEQDVEWFRSNRQSIMSAVPPVRSSKPRQKRRTFRTTPVNPTEPTAPLPAHTTSSDNLEVLIYCNPSYIPHDLYRSSDAYLFYADLPGVVPGRDYVVQTDDVMKVIIKGERRRDPDKAAANFSSIIQQRVFGTFYVEITLPQIVDLAKTEHFYLHGVLSVKIPLLDTLKPTTDDVHTNGEAVEHTSTNEEGL